MNLQENRVQDRSGLMDISAQALEALRELMATQPGSLPRVRVAGFG